MYTNYGLSGPKHRELLQLNDILHDSENLRYIEYCSSGISNRLKELTDHFITNNANPLYQLIISVDPYVKQQNRAAWTEAIKDGMNELGAEYFDSISLAFTERSTTVLFFKLNNTHVVITSRMIPGEQKYFLNLGAMLLDCKDDIDFVKRASEAIQNKTMLTLLEREQQLLKDQQYKVILDTSMTVVNALLTQPRPTARIQNIQNDLNNYMSTVNSLMNQLKELQMLDFAILHNTQMTEENKQELMDYIHSIKDNILDACEDSNKYFYITISSYMQIPESDKDFFKPTAIAYPGHLLHDYPNITKLLTDVMNHKVKLPIRGTYKITKRTDDRRFEIKGTDYRTANAVYAENNYVRNSHVNGYNCFTGYKNQMMEALYAGNIIGLFEIMQQCTASISVFDSAVMPHIIHSINELSPDTKIKIRTDNGWEDIRLEDYYAKIKS